MKVLKSIGVNIIVAFMFVGYLFYIGFKVIKALIRYVFNNVEVLVWIKSHRLITALLMSCLSFGIYYVVWAIKWIPYPNQIDYAEGLIMYVNKMWATGIWKWDVSIPPYQPLIYGIGYPLIDMPLMKMFGDGLWTGRLISSLSAVVIAFMLYFIILRLTNKKLWAIIGALIPFTQPIIRDWSLMARVDFLSVMFDIVGFYLVVRFKDSKYIYLSIIPFVCAMLTKMTNVAGLGAVLIYLLIYNRKVFLKYLAIFIPVVIAIFGSLQVLSGGEYFNHISRYNNTSELIWTWAVIQTNWANLLMPLMILLALAFARLKSHIWKRLDLLDLFLICAFIIEFVSGLRPGGFLNYYLEFVYATCICAILVTPTMFERLSSPTYEQSKAPYMLLTGLMFIFMVLVCTKTAFPFPNEQYDRDVSIVTEMVSDTDKPIICENPGLVYNMGKEVYIEFFILTNMTKLGYWDDTNYVNGFKNQEYDYVIMRIPLYKRPVEGDGHFPKNVMDAIKENYVLVYDPPENFYWYGISLYESSNKILSDGHARVP